MGDEVNPLSTLPNATYVTVLTLDGRPVDGMRLANGNILVRMGDVIGEATQDQFKGWME